MIQSYLSTRTVYILQQEGDNEAKNSKPSYGSISSINAPPCENASCPTRDELFPTQGPPRRAEKLAVLSPPLLLLSLSKTKKDSGGAAPIHSPPRRRREHDNDSAIANVSKRAGRERGEVAADGGCFACHPITIDDDYDGDELGNRERRSREAHRHRDERAE